MNKWPKTKLEEFFSTCPAVLRLPSPKEAASLHAALKRSRPPGIRLELKGEQIRILPTPQEPTVEVFPLVPAAGGGSEGGK